VLGCMAGIAYSIQWYSVRYSWFMVLCFSIQCFFYGIPGVLSFGFWVSRIVSNGIQYEIHGIVL